MSMPNRDGSRYHGGEMNSTKIILHLCADIGSDSQPYRDAGYDVRCIGKDIGVENYHPPENVYGIIANPPCTMFSLARTRAKTKRDFREGMFCVQHCLRIIWEARYINPLKFWIIENPRGFMRQFLGIPTFTYQQWEYGDTSIKPTDIWGYFKTPSKKIRIKPDGLSEKFPNGSTNAKGWSKSAYKRSIAPAGFAKAFFAVNQ